MSQHAEASFTILNFTGIDLPYTLNLHKSQHAEASFTILNALTKRIKKRNTRHVSTRRSVFHNLKPSPSRSLSWQGLLTPHPLTSFSFGENL